MKKIEFIEVAAWSGRLKPTNNQEQYEYVELIMRGHDGEYDLMLAHSGTKDNGVAYWGNWNGGNR